MNDAKFNGLIRAPKQGRYAYFVNTAVENEAVFSLSIGNNLATSISANGATVVCVWPAKEFAEHCKKGAWSDAEVVQIALSDFYLKILPDFKKQGISVGVFYNGVDMSVVSVQKLSSDLKEYIQNIGSDWMEEDD